MEEKRKIAPKEKRIPKVHAKRTENPARDCEEPVETRVFQP